MAENILSVVAEEIVGKLISLATEQISLSWGFKEDLKRLRDSLTTIQAVLADAERRQAREEQVRLWLRRLKDVSYDADDVLDDLAYEILRRKVEIQNQMKRKVSYFFSFSNPMAFHFKMANNVKNIHESLNMIIDEANKYEFTRAGPINANPEMIPNRERETDSSLDPSEVVGREHDASKIVKLLLNEVKQQLSVIPIVGMAGLGKTTLAKLVYNNELLQEHFDEKIWVCVSDNFSNKRILSQILESLTHSSSILENKNAIYESLKKELKGKRYLLVLDDVWNEDSHEWDTLKESLLGINPNIGNNIIVTTRSNKVAEIMRTLPKHNMENLLDKECWEIIKNRVSTKERIPLTQELEDIGREIAKRCHGIPLVAKVIGGSMSWKIEESEWLKIQNNMVWNSQDDNECILSILKLSFDHLYPPSLKRCFTYCAIFPKDYAMEKEELVQHWMAEGFLQPSQKHFSMEDVGFEYFDILMGNSLFQDIERDNSGDIISCKMHDLVHDPALSISRWETLHLKGMVRGDINGMSHIQRLSLISNEQKTPTIPLFRDDMGRLRTIFSIRASLGDRLLDLKCVRGLTLVGRNVGELPKSIGEFRHLRFLHIEKTNIKELPISVTKLYNLQTLIIKDCHLLEELPNDLRNLTNLRHINISNEYIKQLPVNMGKLTCLQTLPFFVIGQDDGHRIEEVGCLSQLRGGLSIYNLENVRDKEEAKTANLMGKTGVCKLGFHWSIERVGNNNDEDVLEGLQPHQHLKCLEIENFRGEKLPSWILARDIYSGGFLLGHLMEIRLKNCDKCNKLPTLGHLPHLMVLEIDGMDNVTCIGTEFYINYSGERSSNSGGGSDRNVVFPALKKLVLKKLPNLVEWKDALELTTIEAVFPCLEKLTIESCGQLTSAPYHFLTLKKLKISGIKSTAFERIISKLSTLASLKIEYILELVYLPEQLFQNNRSLMSIFIGDCFDLVSISPHQDVTSLQSIKIRECEKLSEWPNALRTFPSLERFDVFFCPNLRSFPSLQGAGSRLRSLMISCGDEVLPTGLESCTSLSALSIECPNLISIPELPELHSLTKLQICECF
ncbi:putative disease resistance protein RGA3 [Quercus lobata]|uniref:putative disease resistance protein RGA3 n=1 Tax=Quercus lobata TaxID=97700 RepID=UPI001248D822|nr:putative disease resistance protein RGA3 [Quercus lobata]